MPKNPGCDTYDVKTIDGQTVEILDEEVEALAAAFLEDALEVWDDPDDAMKRSAIVTVLQLIDGDWGYHEWKSLADKHKHHQETTQ